jgi:hypothetical protein
MKITEYVDFTLTASQRKVLCNWLKKENIKFERVHDMVRLNLKYQRGFSDLLVNKLTIANVPFGTVGRQYDVQFESIDFNAADFVHLKFRYEEVSFAACEQNECKCCHRIIFSQDYRIRTDALISRNPILGLDALCVVVNRKMKKQIEDNLQGGVLTPIDLAENYFYLRGRTSLGLQIILPVDGIDVDGRCNKCNIPKYGVNLGPLRRQRGDANLNHDIVNGDVFGGPVFSKRGIKLLKKYSIPCLSSPIYLAPNVRCDNRK